MESSDLGDRMKFYEGMEADRRFIPMLPTLARLDGRAFHSFCRGLEQPYDPRFRNLMVEVTQFLVEKTGACVGYTQSDEISLVWLASEFKEQIFFDGRIMKMTSTLAALATAKFNSLIPKYLPEKEHLMPMFDCRVWQVPNQIEAANTFLWRELDATKNSVSSAARTYFSHGSLIGLNSSQLQERLWNEKGINWNDYPAEFKRGVWIQRRVITKPFTAEEFDKLPPKHKARSNPDLVIERKKIQKLDMPPFRRVANREAVIFDGADPIPIAEEKGE